MIDPKVLQGFLKIGGYYTGAIDGLFGGGSYLAARACLKANGVDATTWSNARTYLALSQLFLNKTIHTTLVIDGLNGPNTEAAIYQYTQSQLRTVTNVWPRQSSVRAGTSIFGRPGTNQGVVTCPYTMWGDYARTIKVNRFGAHNKVVPSIQRVLKKTLDHYGLAKIRQLNLDIFSGCYNYRRVASSSSLSLHSWGIAVDIDAAHNALNRQDYEGAAFAKPVYSKFLDFWEEEGWVSLGRARNYDWMHFQAARF